MKNTTVLGVAGYRSAGAGDLKRLGDRLTERAIEHGRGHAPTHRRTDEVPVHVRRRAVPCRLCP
jgi:hypothetical protein